VPRVTARLPVATFEGRNNPKFSASKDDWRVIETAYKRKLSEKVREQICQATHGFLSSVEVEQVAAPQAEAREHLVQIIKTAGALRHVLSDNPAGDGWDARVYATRLVDQRFESSRLVGISAGVNLRKTYRSRRREGLTVTDVFVDLTGSLIAACNQALEDLNEHPGRRKGEAWDNWVCRISEIAESSQLPNGVTKTADTRKQSPFVELIWALQALIPMQYRRSTHSKPALAVAITRARKVT
jgi:hypothetical protein